MFINYSSLKYSEFVLAYQQQFGTYEAENEHFQWEKERRHFNELLSSVMTLAAKVCLNRIQSNQWKIENCKINMSASVDASLIHSEAPLKYFKSQAAGLNQ